MFQKLLTFFKKEESKEFTHNQEDFLLKHEATWFSDTYRYIMYSANKGESWEYLMNCEKPLFTSGSNILEYNYKFEKETFNVERVAFSRYKEQFKTYQDVLDYHEKEHNSYLKGLKEVQEGIEKYLEMIRKNSL